MITKCLLRHRRTIVKAILSRRRWAAVPRWLRGVAIKLDSWRRRRSSSTKGRGRTKARIHVRSKRIRSVIGVVDLPSSPPASTSPKRCTAVRTARMRRTALGRLNILAVECRWLKFDPTKEHRLMHVDRARDLIIHAGVSVSFNLRGRQRERT